VLNGTHFKPAAAQLGQLALQLYVAGRAYQIHGY
jgi:hypothetical protein